MGGNALNFKTRRVLRDEFFILQDEIIAILQSVYPTIEIVPLISYRNKESFGDIDFLVKSDTSIKFSFSTIKGALNSKDYSLNSGSWSFDYKDFQVDLNFHSPENWDSANLYFSWGDAGNLLGRISHKLGLKFGHKGLSYLVRCQGGHVFSEIVLARNGAQIMPCLGLSYERYCAGFDSLEDIYEFVASSSFFNPDIYLLENRNHHSRTRDRKRPMYTEFLKWCSARPDLQHFQFSDNKEDYFDYIESHFPGFKERVNCERIKINRTEQFKQLYNGAIVSEITGLQGKELGIFMAKIVNKFESKENLIEKTLDNGAEWVKLVVEEVFKRETVQIS